jgi:glycosyltransferase involved in cell wall biosynthesis
MRIGLNLVYLVPGETGGMEVYARELVPALMNAAPGLEITAFINREAAASGIEFGDGVSNVVVPVNARSRVEWVRGEQQYLPSLGRRERIDLLHSLASTAPARGPFARVTTIHDLIYRRFPQAHFGIRTLGMRILVPLAARRSHRIIAVSRSTADDLEDFLGLSPNAIDVIYLAQGDPRQRLAAPEPEAAVRARWQLGERPLALTLSAKRPVKNLARLLEALVLLPAERRPVLVMPGYPTPYEEVLRRRITEVGLVDDVRMPGWITEEQLEGLWRVASCFVFPSLYEGFGLPVLEAMRRGVPVACSDTSSLPEVAGNAARFFDPERPEEIASALEELLQDQHKRDELIKLGFAQADRFTWAETARRTLETYERALSTRSSSSTAAVKS